MLCAQSEKASVTDTEAGLIAVLQHRQWHLQVHEATSLMRPTPKLSIKVFSHRRLRVFHCAKRLKDDRNSTFSPCKIVFTLLT